MHALVLALNPSIDVEWRVDGVRWEEKNAVLSERRWPGGKGVNVARWLLHLGARARLLLPLGGSTGAELAAGLRTEKIPARIIALSQPTRANVIITAPAQGQLRFNPLGPELSGVEWRKLLQETKRELPRVSVLVLSGSLPRGLQTDAYATLIRLGQRAGVKTLLDCDGLPFAEALAAQPFLVKPNQHELAQWCGRPLRSETALKKAALELSALTHGWVLLSLGAKGALLVHQREGFCEQAQPPPVTPRNTVGAGDALLAAVAQQIGENAPPRAWLRRGVAAGSALTQCAAGALPDVRSIGRLLRLVG